jgi:hypothetical protein
MQVAPNNGCSRPNKLITSFACAKLAPVLLGD